MGSFVLKLQPLMLELSDMYLYRYTNDRRSDKLKNEGETSPLSDKAHPRWPPPSLNTAEGRAPAAVTSCWLLFVCY